MIKHYTGVLRKYVQFSGRAQREEYWYFILFNTIIIVIISIVGGLIFRENNYLTGLYTIAVLLPGLAVSMRRLHDTNHSGWWLLVSIIPFIGAFILLLS
tara:strand:- start:561 stop:857 length:297 start_codon:yes stop_codon:yes gene_type:complete